MAAKPADDRAASAELLGSDGIWWTLARRCGAFVSHLAPGIDGERQETIADPKPGCDETSKRFEHFRAALDCDQAVALRREPGEDSG
jgi:hypothetical protein